MGAWLDDEEQGTNEEVVEQPIVSIKPDLKEEEKYNDVYRDNVNNTSLVPIADLLVHAAGYSWTIPEFYNQILGEDQAGAGYSESLSDIVQQYTLIRDLEIKVESPLTQTLDEESNEWEVVGAAVLYAGLKPNRGDMMVADIGDGRKAFLQITSTRAKSILTQACYAIEYKVVGYLTDAISNGLNEKTVRTYNYYRERAANATSALLTEESSNWLHDGEEALRTLQRSFSLMFLDEQEKTLRVPIDSEIKKLYDPEIVDLVQRSGMLPEIIRPVVYSSDKAITLVDFLLGEDMFQNLIAIGSSHTSTRELRETPVFGGLGYTTFNYYVKPKSIELPEATGELLELPNFSTITEEQSTYIASVNFYRNFISSESNQLTSKLEQQMQAFLKDESLDTPLLLKLASETSTLDKLSAFYQIPIVYLLLKVALDEL